MSYITDINGIIFNILLYFLCINCLVHASQYYSKGTIFHELVNVELEFLFNRLLEF